MSTPAPNPDGDLAKQIASAERVTADESVDVELRMLAAAALQRAADQKPTSA